MNEAETEKAVSFDPRIVLRPRSLDEVIDLSFAYLRIHFRDFRRLFLFQLALGLGVTLLLRVGLDQGWSVVWAAAFVLGPLSEKTVLVFGGDHLFGNPSSLRLALRRVTSRIFPLVVGAIIVPLPVLPVLIAGEDIEVMIGFAVMTALFWPFVLAWFLYFGTTLLLENLSLGATLKRSTSLIRFRFGRAIFFVSTAFTMRFAIVIAVELFSQFALSFVLQLGAPLDALFTNGGSYPSVLAYFLAAPVISLARMFDYVDTRTRLEGWDLQVRFRALASRPRGGRSGLAA